jgi:hypothetical protein
MTIRNAPKNLDFLPKGEAMPGWTNYRNDMEMEPDSMDPERAPINAKHNQVACPRCGAQADASQKVCSVCRRPLKGKKARAGKGTGGHTISKAVYYGLIFQGFLAGIGILVVIVVAFHICIMTIKSAIS